MATIVWAQVVSPEALTMMQAGAVASVCGDVGATPLKPGKTDANAVPVLELTVTRILYGFVALGRGG
jgi:hypothetical protein